MHESVTSYLYYLENNGSFADFSYAEFNYAIVDLQNCMLISPSYQKSLQALGGCQTHSERYKLFKILILLESSTFYRWQ